MKWYVVQFNLWLFFMHQTSMVKFDLAKILQKNAEWEFNRCAQPHIEPFFFSFLIRPERSLHRCKKKRRRERNVMILPQLLCLSLCLRLPITVTTFGWILPGVVQVWAHVLVLNYSTVGHELVWMYFRSWLCISHTGMGGDLLTA